MLKRLLFLVILILLAAGAYVAYEAHTFLNTPGSAEPREIIIAIEPGDTFDRVAWKLKKHGVITDVPRFRLLARWHKALGSVKAGEFLVSTAWKPGEVLYQITKGQALLYRLSLREGLTWWETAKAVEAAGFATYEDFKAVIHDPEFLQAHSIPYANAEGFLFPETYLLKKPKQLDREQARIVADILVKHFWKRTEDLWRRLPAREGAEMTEVTRPAPLPDSGASAQAVNASSRAASNATAPEADNALPAVNATTAANAVHAANFETDAPASNATAPETDNALPDSDKPAQPSNATAPEAGSTTLPAANASTPAAPLRASAGDGSEVRGPARTSPSEPSDPVVFPAASPPVFGPATPADIEPEALKRWLVLATLVEKETGVPAERARVAGVYANRLRTGMILQCDPTIIYGLGEKFKHPLRLSQLKDEKNLYNTYIHPGLPPGPICSPGFQALAAAFTPEEHGYLFFVATGRDDGSHTFSKNVTDHNKAVREYRKTQRNKP